MPLIERIANFVSQKSRQKKLAQFLGLLQPGPTDTVIDVGVNTEEYSAADNFLERNYPYPGMITALGQGSMSHFSKLYPQVKTAVGNGLALPFPDNSFEIAYSNAVIEHVGDRDAQAAFARELYRVGKRGYLTTPNRLFPIEIHTRIPLFHLFLSKKKFDRLVSRLGKAWAAGDYMSLLSERELRAVLRQAGITTFQLYKNRFFGWPMTFTVIWKKNL